jgi:hypothetical protein
VRDDPDHASGLLKARGTQQSNVVDNVVRGPTCQGVCCTAVRSPARRPSARPTR